MWVKEALMIFLIINLGKAVEFGPAFINRTSFVDSSVSISFYFSNLTNFLGQFFIIRRCLLSSKQRRIVKFTRRGGLMCASSTWIWYDARRPSQKIFQPLVQIQSSSNLIVRTNISISISI